MARFDRSSDGPVPYGPSGRPPESAGQTSPQDATPRVATPSDGAPPPPPTTQTGTPDLAPPEPSPVLAPPPPPSIPAAPSGVPVPPPVAPWTPPPGAFSTGVSGAPGLEYGRTLDRVMAYWLDSILIGVPTLILTVVLVGGAGTQGLGRVEGAAVVAGVITAGANLIYFVAFWTGSAGATPAMRLMKLQMGDAGTGATPTVPQGMLRWLALGGIFSVVAILPAVAGLASGLQAIWILLLLVTTATSPTKQGLHDRIAKTALVQPAGAQTPARTCLFMLVALMVIWVVGIVALIFLGGQVSRILSTVGSSI